MTAFAWFHKPADVRYPVHLHSRATIAEITAVEPGSSRTDWRNTPLDFVDANGPGWAMNVQPFMHLFVIPPERPIHRIPNDRFPMNPYGVQEYCLCFATLLFTGIHVTGWNFSFPSDLERILWRVSGLVLFGVTAAFWVFETMASWKRLGRWTRLYLRMRDPDKLQELDSQRSEEGNNTKPREMATLPLPWEFWTIMPIALLYGLARTFMLVEGLIELRDADATAFVTVNWSTYIPHM